MCIRLYIIGLFILVSVQAIGQEQTCLHAGNWSGVTSLYYNPSAFSASLLDWDLQLVAGGVFAETDYAYIENTSVYELLARQPDLIDATFTDGIRPNGNQVLYRYQDAVKPMDNAIQAFMALPAFALRVNRKWSLGFLTKTRVAFNANGVDPIWSYPSLSNWSIGQTKTSSPIWTTGMMWSEAIINLAYAFKTNGVDVHIGANSKLLIGHHGLTAFVPNSTDITFYQNYYHVDAQEAHYSFTDFSNGFTQVANGVGFGLDLGITVNKRAEDGSIAWRIQAAILDAGQVHFTTNSSQHYVEANSTQYINRAALLGIQSLEAFAANISTDVYGDPNATLAANDFSITTPTALTFAFDYALPNSIWLTVSTARSILVNPYQLHRDNHITASLRYETKWFEFGVPIVLHNDIHARAGAWIRVGPFTMGSDHITSWFIPQRQLTGTDVYFALRLNNLFFKSKKWKSPDECYW